MDMLGLLIYIGASSVLFLIVSLIQYWLMLREDSGLDTSIDKAITLFIGVFWFASLPVSLPFTFVMVLHSKRFQRKMDHDMAIAAHKYDMKCSDCPYGYCENKPFGYDARRQVWTDS